MITMNVIKIQANYFLQCFFHTSHTTDTQEDDAYYVCMYVYIYMFKNLVILHCLQKVSSPACYNSNTRDKSTDFDNFGRNVIEKVNNRKVLHFRTSPN